MSLMSNKDVRHRLTAIWRPTAFNYFIRLMLFAAVIAVGIYIRHEDQQPAPPLSTPEARQICGDAWQTVARRYLEPERLPESARWKDRIEAVKSEEEAALLLSEMLSTLGDPYSFVRTTEAIKANNDFTNGVDAGAVIPFERKVDKGGSPIIVLNAQGYPVVGAPAPDASGLEPGDVVMAINGKSTKGAGLNSLTSDLRANAEKSVKVTVERRGIPVEVTITCLKVNVSAAYSRLTENGVGYLRIQTFGQSDTAEETRKELLKLEQARAIVLDLRGNGGGWLEEALQVISLFVDSGPILMQETRIESDPAKPVFQKTVTELSASAMNARLVTQSAGAGPGRARKPYMLAHRALVILIDGQTGSAAELVAAVLKERTAAVVVGQRSFGKGISQEEFPLVKDRLTVNLTTGKWLTPAGLWLGDGNRTRNGLGPDLVMEAPRAYAPGTAGDAQLQLAMNYVRALPAIVSRAQSRR